MPIRGKLAFTLARTLKATPSLRPYYADWFAGARVIHAAEARWQAVQRALNGEDPAPDDATRAAMARQADSYQAIADALDLVLRNIPHDYADE